MPRSSRTRRWRLGARRGLPRPRGDAAARCPGRPKSDGHVHRGPTPRTRLRLSRRRWGRREASDAAALPPRAGRRAVAASSASEGRGCGVGAACGAAARGAPARAALPAAVDLPRPRSAAETARRLRWRAGRLPGGQCRLGTLGCTGAAPPRGCGARARSVARA